MQNTSENVLPLDQPKRQPQGVRTKPVLIRRLHTIMGTNTAVAAAVGCAASNISAALREDDVALSYELAAGYILARDYQQGRTKAAFITGPDHIIKTVEDIINAAGGKFAAV